LIISPAAIDPLTQINGTGCAMHAAMIYARPQSVLAEQNEIRRVPLRAAAIVLIKGSQLLLVGSDASTGDTLAMHFFRRAAGYVDRILKGAKPGELPASSPPSLICTST
jgi:hypothetical protein